MMSYADAVLDYHAALSSEMQLGGHLKFRCGFGTSNGVKIEFVYSECMSGRDS
jgi:hypothetical protein